MEVVEETDWLAEWKKHWRPTRVGRFLIAPSWENVNDVDSDTIVIRIEPNMAFGTGTHETTKLCLQAIDRHYRPEMSFLDVGTGTGILAIAAAKVQEAASAVNGKASVLAIEIDTGSVAIARENAVTNAVADKLEIREQTLNDTVPAFDFVCANLTIDIILQILPLLVDRFKRALVLSGILAEQEQIITSELAKFDAGQHAIERDGEWISVLIKR
jgi:ribosomal protein L11 methyltransferase